MKKLKLLLLLLAAFVLQIRAQVAQQVVPAGATSVKTHNTDPLPPQAPQKPEMEWISPEGVLDNLYDRFGKKYRLSDLKIKRSMEAPTNTGNPGKTGGASTNAVTFVTCNSGYFKLYFETGSGMEGNTVAEINRRNVMCQVFSDIAQFISSPLTGNGGQVNIHVRDIVNMGVANPSTDPTLGLGSPFYSIPSIQNIGGIADNMIWQTIVSGTDAYTNVANPLVTPAASGGNFYHGQVSFNFANPSMLWNDQLGIPPAPSEFDLYTVMLHEVMHTMGFGSLIDQTGLSKMGATFPYYSRYDTYLQTQAGFPLIVNSSNCTNTKYDWNWNPSLNPAVLEPNPSLCLPDNTNCAAAINFAGSVLQPVYTPNCFAGGSTLSHFEDQCAPAVPGNNLYFVMSNANGTGPAYMKRYMKSEERDAFCDMGYTCGSTFGNPGNLNNFTYSAPPCFGAQVAGINDGINLSGFYTFIGPVSSAIAITGILGNDQFTTPNNNIFTCMEVILGSGSLSSTSGVSTNYTPSTPGLHLLRYVPVDGSTGIEGNITYVYVYAQSGNCTPSSCNIVNNGGFENGTNCGQYTQQPITINCWSPINDTPDYFVRNCVPSGNPGMTVPTNWCTPTADTWSNGSPGNDKWIGGWAMTGNYTTSEAMQNQLSSPILPNTPYILSFWARITNGWTSVPNTPGNVIFAGATGQLVHTIGAMTALPGSVTQLASAVVPPNNQWNYFSIPFTYTGSQSLTYFSIFPAGWLNTNTTYLFFDDVSIVPANSSVTFSQPPPICQGQSLTDLNNYTSIPGGTFSGTGVSFNGGTNLYEFNAGLNTAPGVHQVLFSYVVNGCSYTLAQDFTITPGSVSATASSTTICTSTTNTVSLSATGNPAPGGGAVYTWYPGPLSGPNQIVSPTSNTTYTVSLTYPGGCTVYTTIAINVTNNCCPQNTLGMSVVNNVINGSATISGPGVVYGNVVLNGPGLVDFNGGEFLMAPGSQITVMPGTILKLTSVHMYACGNDMWNGIVVQDGAGVLSGAPSPNSVMIEDALIAIDVSNITAAHVYPPLEINHIIFNKNDIGINISNSVLNSIDFMLRSCVFSSRDYPFTSTTWPGSTMNSPDLRYAAPGATLGLAAPYDMQNAPIGNLKNPYNMRSSHYGIKISNIGNTFGTPTQSGIGITYWNTYGSSPSDFNLFDAMGTGIDVENSSLSIQNNVFQNGVTQYVTTGPGAPYYLLGRGVMQMIYNGMNARLDMLPDPTQQYSDMGNRFWECYEGVTAYDILEINMENALFRSTQQTSGISGYNPGNRGIYINTAAFQYGINKNEFNNINRPIRMNIYNGTYDVGGGMTSGIYGGGLDIKQNYFGPEVSSSTPLSPNTEYVNSALEIYGPNWGSWNMVGAANILSNKIDRSWRGISVTELGSFPLNINGNLINLEDDFTLFNRQYGIELQSTVDNVTVAENTLTAVNPNSNPQVSLIHCNKTQGSFNSPYLRCNDVSMAFTGFEFVDQNPGTVWITNYMQSCERGMALTNNGYIGPQGNPGFPHNNEWLGAWGGTDYTTWADATSFPNLSPLFINMFGTYVPTNNGGANPGQDYNMPGAIQPGSGGQRCKAAGYPPVPTNKTTAPVSIVSQSNASEWNVEMFPNPTSGNVNIVSKKESERLSITISDVGGKIILRKNVTTADFISNIDVPAEQGVYFIEITNDQNNRIYKKLVIAK